MSELNDFIKHIEEQSPMNKPDLWDLNRWLNDCLKDKEGHSSFEKDVLNLLCHITNYHFIPNSSEPYQPFFVFGEKRSGIPDDLKIEQFGMLMELKDVISNVFLKARVLDVLWLKHKGVELLRESVQSYLKSLELLLFNEKKSFTRTDIYLRCAYLCKKSPALTETFDDLSRIIKQDLEASVQTCNDWTCGELIDISRRYKILSFDLLLNWAETISINLSKDKNLHLSRSYYDLCVKLCEKDKKDFYRLKAIETLKEEASINKDSPLVASSALTDAIKRIRQVPNQKGTVEELKAELTNIQSKQKLHMKTFTQTLEIPNNEDKLRKALKGSSKLKSLYEFYACSAGIVEDQISEACEKILDKNSIIHHISNFAIGKYGQMVFEKPSPLSEDEDEKKLGLECAKHSHAALQRSLSATMYIIPILRILRENFPEGFRDLVFKAVNVSPFVPDGHHEIIARGILSGFSGDFLVANLIMFTQFEELLRSYLLRLGVPVTKLTNIGNQPWIQLNTLLDHEEIVKVLGKDIVYDLKSALTDKYGSNKRNESAHGYMTSNEYCSQESIYLWWAISRIIMISSLNHFMKEEESNV